MKTKKLFFFSKNLTLYLLGIVLLIVLQNCNKINSLQENTGFLTYSSGYGLTEGVHIASYQNADSTKGYILLGSADNGIEKDFFIIKTDILGNILLSKQIGDHNIDNIPKKVEVKDDLIYILGDRYDRVIDRTVPYFLVLGLENLTKKNEIYLDIISGFDTISGVDSSRYEELSADFFIDKDKVIVASTLENLQGGLSLLTYTIPVNAAGFPDYPSSSFNKYDDLDALFPGYKMKAKSIKKGDDCYYIAGTFQEEILYNEYGRGFFIVKYNYDAQPLGVIFNEKDADEYTILLDFEVDLENNKAILLYRNKNLAKISIIDLPITGDQISANVLTPEFLGFVYAIDTARYGLTLQDIIDETKSASINKIGNNYIITGIKEENFAMIVDKRKLNGDYLSEPEWGKVWEESNAFNNISSIGLHTRNNIGNVIRRIEGTGYAIIGTQDFLNDTKIMLMQLDENGNYIQ